MNLKKPDHNYPYCHPAGRHLTIPVTTTRNIPWEELLFLTLRNSRLHNENSAQRGFLQKFSNTQI